MPSKAKNGAVKQHLAHCQLCGWEVEKPCDTAGQVKRCRYQQQNKARGGVSADVVRAVMRGGKPVIYVPVSDREVRALIANS